MTKVLKAGINDSPKHQQGSAVQIAISALSLVLCLVGCSVDQEPRFAENADALGLRQDSSLSSEISAAKSDSTNTTDSVDAGACKAPVRSCSELPDYVSSFSNAFAPDMSTWNFGSGWSVQMPTGTKSFGGCPQQFNLSSWLQATGGKIAVAHDLKPNEQTILHIPVNIADATSFVYHETGLVGYGNATVHTRYINRCIVGGTYEFDTCGKSEAVCDGGCSFRAASPGLTDIEVVVTAGPAGAPGPIVAVTLGFECTTTTP